MGDELPGAHDGSPVPEAPEVYARDDQGWLTFQASVRLAGDCSVRGLVDTVAARATSTMSQCRVCIASPQRRAKAYWRR
jgi:hypothetical protein